MRKQVHRKEHSEESNQAMRKILTILFLISAATLWAIPARKGLQAVLQPDGSIIMLQQNGDEKYHYLTNAEGNMVERTESGQYIATDEKMTDKRLKKHRAEAVELRRSQKINLAPRGLFLLVNFSNVKFKDENGHDAMNEMLNGDTYTHDGAYASVRQYFIQQSDSVYMPQFDVVGPVTLDSTYDWYGKNDRSGYDRYMADFVIEACQKADSLVDFSLYDNDNDGTVDFVYLIYAGRSENEVTTDPNLIWPMSSELYSLVSYGYSAKYTTRTVPTFDGKKIGSLAYSSELNRDYRRCGIGTLCHEFSHVLGLPDYYNTVNQSSYYTPETWSLMSMGAYNNDGKYPPNYSVYDKYFLGWVTPQMMDTAENVILPNDLHTYRMVTADGQQHSAMQEGEMWFFENRQKTGWDTYLPGHGMLVWYVDYNDNIWSQNEVNSRSNKSYLDVVRAGGVYVYNGTASDPFPGTSDIEQYTPVGEYSLTQIEEDADGTIRFKFMGGVQETATAIPTTELQQQIIEVYSISGEYIGYTLPHNGLYICKIHKGDTVYFEKILVK